MDSGSRRTNVATLHLMVGLPCSGKTTLARELENTHSALRLTTDEWHIRLFGPDYWDNMTKTDEAIHDSRHAEVESIMWEVAARALGLATDVILDFGCWVTSIAPGPKSWALTSKFISPTYPKTCCSN